MFVSRCKPHYSPRWSIAAAKGMLRRGGALLLVAALFMACGLRAAVSLTMRPAQGTPHDASVIIDEQFVGLLGYVAARGVRLPEGEHRITVEREGYFPWDRIVESDRKPITLEVELIPIPD